MQTILLLCVLWTSVQAQIVSPELYCIKNDTLQWTLPQVTCGNVTGYEIYYSENKSGPYDLLTTITNPVQSSYVHLSAGKDYYYYMKTLADCPGQMALSSDTLDNVDPPTVPIQAVNVVGGKCEISWQIPSTNKQLSFIIYRTTANGTLPVDTISNANSYLDLGSNPALKSESYYVLALDLCGNASIFDKPHFSIFAETSVDYCTRQLKLKWTKYQNWDHGVKQYQIWTSVNGAAATMIDTTDALTTEYILKDVSNGNNLCVFVNAVQSVTGITASSNEICAVMDVVKAVKWIEPLAASVRDDNTIDFKWAWNDDADIKAAGILVGTNLYDISTQSTYAFSTPISGINSFNYSGKNPSVTPVFFKINADDVCNSKTTSLTLSTIFLKAKANEDKTNTLIWEFPEQANLNIKNYNIYKRIAGVESLLNVLPPESFQLNDQVDIDKPEQVEICYYVVADAEMTLADGSKIQEQIRSNTICVRQFANLFFPNAIVPEGINNEFKPVSVFAQDASYLLVIYDRWGQLIFETTDINQGWKGKKGNDPLPQGVYVYYARLQQPDGRLEERKGQVMLIR